MTRAMGDHSTRHIGVISTPEVGQPHELSNLDYGIIIASDGIFE